MKSRFRSGDMVEVLVGKDKGKTGSVLKLIAPNKVLVQGVNKKSRHQKPNPQKGTYGGVYLSEHPIDASNVRKVVSTDAQ